MLLVDSIFFYLIASNKIISKIDKETEPIMALLAYMTVLSIKLQLSSSI